MSRKLDTEYVLRYYGIPYITNWSPDGSYCGYEDYILHPEFPLEGHFFYSPDDFILFSLEPIICITCKNLGSYCVKCNLLRAFY